MKQQEKLKICAKALGLEYAGHDEEGVYLAETGLPHSYLCPYKQLAVNLVTTLGGIATWQDTETKEWYACKKYNFYLMPNLIEITTIDKHTYTHKDYAQAVIDCVAGGGS